MEDMNDLLKQLEQLQNNSAFLPNDAPWKIYCDHDCMGNAVMVHNMKWPEDKSENIEYIRKDVVEHIIASALGLQDALNKLRSL